jgi:nicotinamide riboside kinase
MICTISGAQGVGKTTLINKMKIDDRFNDWEIVDEIVRSLYKNGININENGNSITQLAITNSHLLNIYNTTNNKVLDRCLLDSVVYSKYLYDSKKIDECILTYSECALLDFIEKYDYMFYISPEFPLIDDGVRSVDPIFRTNITDIFEYYVDIISYKKNIIRLTGSVDNRYEIIINTIFHKI